MKRFLLMSTALCVSGCSAYTVERTAPPPHVTNALEPELARLCVVRSTVIGMALTTPVRDNGLVVGATQGPSWFCWLAGPGLHTLSVETSDAPAVEIRVEAGEQRVFEHQIAIGQDRLVELPVTGGPEAPPGVAATTRAAELVGYDRYVEIRSKAAGSTNPASVVPGL